jgi:hypothetical protein
MTNKENYTTQEVIEISKVFGEFYKLCGEVGVTHGSDRLTCQRRLSFALNEFQSYVPQNLRELLGYNDATLKNIGEETRTGIEKTVASIPK